MTLALPTPAGTAVSGRRAWLAALTYLATLAALCAIAFWLLAGLLGASAQVSAAEAMLAQLNGRQAHAGATAGADAQAAQSPFLEGQTVTVAGAALQRRIEAAAAKAGGAIVSSQVELDGPQAKDGFITVTSNLELAQDKVQPFLYDLEAGMPFLFVDALSIQAPEAAGDGDKTRMRVLVGVTGQWRASP